MNKILSIVVLLSSVLLAEISVKSMMDTVDVSIITDVNVSKGIDTIKDMTKEAMDVGFSWKDDLDKAFETAKKTDKRVMVMVEGENCRWCKKMIHRTIGDDAVQKKLAEKYISVRVQREDLETMKNLPEVRGVPTVFFMDKDKNMIEEVIGYFDVLDFTSYISDVDKKMKQP